MTGTSLTSTGEARLPRLRSWDTLQIGIYLAQLIQPLDSSFFGSEIGFNIQMV